MFSVACATQPYMQTLFVVAADDDEDDGLDWLNGHCRIYLYQIYVYAVFGPFRPS